MVMSGTMEGVESAAFMPQVVYTLHSWCTPTVLFLLLIIVIGTIEVTSRMRPNQNNPGNLRTPSLLSRISSISFSRRSYEGEPLGTWNRPPELAVEDNAIPEPDAEMEERKTSQTEKKKNETKDVDDGGVFATGLKQRAAPPKKIALGRSKSDSQPLSDAKPPPPPLPGKMHKYGTFEAGHYGRKAAEPPVASRVRAPRSPPEQVEESVSGAEVDAKADDFINKFKQQLKLQRLESLLRSKDTLGRA